MAKPMEGEPGSAMHIHQSLADMRTGRNLFADEDGSVSPLFRSYLAGLQKYTPALMPIFAPYINSYRRLSRFMAAPINVQWGYDNRTCGLRVPPSDPANRRLENRIPSSDANPYLAIAASLAAGYLGMVQGLKPAEPVDIDASVRGVELPRSLSESLKLFEACQPLVDILGPTFCAAYDRVKQAEYETFMRTISPWEREFLLLNV
jgi:glutamine synthetase